MFAGDKEGNFYSRIGNPTVGAFEHALASLEGSEAAVTAASGMAAISLALWTLLKAGDQLVADKTLYGCTFALLEHGLAKFGVDVAYADFTDHKEFAKAFSQGTRLVYFETPANPNVRVADISAVWDIAHRSGAPAMVDNTYMTLFCGVRLNLAPT